MEEPLVIKSRKPKYAIYGHLTVPNKKSDKVLIIVHGLTGWMHEGKNRQCAKYFAGKGWSTLRINLYGWEPDARRLDRLTIADHGIDIDLTITALKRRGYKKICVAGHSLGWSSILKAKLRGVSAVISWDGPTPEALRQGVPSYGKYRKDVRGHIVDWGVKHILGRKMVEEMRTYPAAEHVMRNFKVPFLLVRAECGPYRLAALQEYREASTVPSKLINIPKASHNFAEEGCEERLIRETYGWCHRWAKSK